LLAQGKRRTQERASTFWWKISIFRGRRKTQIFQIEDFDEQGGFL